MHNKQFLSEESSFLNRCCRTCQFINSNEKMNGKCVCLASLFSYSKSRNDILNTLNTGYGLHIAYSDSKLPYFIKRNLRKNEIGSHLGIAIKSMVSNTMQGKSDIERIANVILDKKDYVKFQGYTVDYLMDMLTYDPEYKKLNNGNQIIDVRNIVKNDVATAFSICVLWAIMGSLSNKNELLHYLKNYTTGVRSYGADYVPVPFIHNGSEGKDIVEELTRGRILFRFGHPGHIIITGAAGSGKTTIVNTIADSIVMNGNSQVSFDVFNLRTVNSEYESLDEYINSSAYISCKNKVLILDGYDEIKDDYKLLFCDILVEAINKWECGFIITSRTDIPALYNCDKEVNRYFVKPIDEQSIYKYLSIDTKEKKALYASLDSHLKTLLTIPFFLSKFKSLWINGGSLKGINCSSALLEEYYRSEGRHSGSKSLLSSEYITEYAIPFSIFHMSYYIHNPTHRTLWQSIRNFNKKYYECDDFAYALISKHIELPSYYGYESNLIKEMGNTLKIVSVDSSNGYISFEHLNIKDYFCAKYIANILRLASEETSLFSRWSILKDSDIAGAKWGPDVCRCVGESINIEEGYHSSSIIAKILDVIRNECINGDTDELPIHLFGNMINVVVFYQKSKSINRPVFKDYDFSNLDFKDIYLNGIDFIGCDFRGAKNFGYDNLVAEGHMGEIITLDAAEDGKTITSIGLDGKIITWDVFNALPIHTEICDLSATIMQRISAIDKFSSDIYRRIKSVLDMNTTNIRSNEYATYKTLANNARKTWHKIGKNKILSITNHGIYFMQLDLLETLTSRTVWNEYNERINLDDFVFVDDDMLIVSNNELYRLDVVAQIDNAEKHFSATLFYTNKYKITSVCSRNYRENTYIVIGDVCGGIAEARYTDGKIRVNYSSKSLWLVTRLIPVKKNNESFIAVPSRRDEFLIFARSLDCYEITRRIKVVNGTNGVEINNLSCYSDMLLIATKSGLFTIQINELDNIDKLNLENCCCITNQPTYDAILVNNDIIILKNSQREIVFSIKEGSPLIELESSYDNQISISTSGRIALYSGELGIWEEQYESRIPWYDNLPAKARMIMESLIERNDSVKKDMLLPFVPQYSFLDDFYDDQYLILIFDNKSGNQLVIMLNGEIIHTKSVNSHIMHATINTYKGTVLFSDSKGHVYEYDYKMDITLEFDMGDSYQRTFAYYSPDSNSIFVSRQAKDIIGFVIPKFPDINDNYVTIISDRHYCFPFDEIRKFEGFAQLVTIEGVDFEDSLFDNTLRDDVKQILKQNGAIID